MKGIQHSYTTKSSEVLREQAPPHQRSRKNATIADLMMMCVPAVGLRVPSCFRCPWQPQRLSSFCHRSLERTLVPPPFQSVPLLPRPKTQTAPRSIRYWSEKKEFSRRVSSTRLCPARRRSISLLHCRRIQPPCDALPCA